MMKPLAPISRDFKAGYDAGYMAAAIEARAEFARLRAAWERDAGAIRREMRALVNQIREERKRDCKMKWPVGHP